MSLNSSCSRKQSEVATHVESDEFICCETGEDTKDDYDEFTHKFLAIA